MNQNLEVVILIVCVIIFGSIEHISIPLIFTQVKSLYFITLLTSINGCILYGIILTIVATIKNKKLFFSKPKELIIILSGGTCNGFMSLLFLYSASPKRTPIVIQTVFLGLTIIPSIILTKFFLKKKNEYTYIYSFFSLFLLSISIIISIVPIIRDIYSSYWIFMYFGAVLFLSLDNILQEKYSINLRKNEQPATFIESVYNRLIYAFYSSIVQVGVVVFCFWFEFTFGYASSHKDVIRIFVSDALNTFTSTKILLIEVIFVDFVALYFACIILNSILTNYNMILTNLTNNTSNNALDATNDIAQPTYGGICNIM